MTISLFALARTLHIGSAMLLVALPFFGTFVVRPATKSGSLFQPTIIRWLWIAWVVEALTGFAWFWLVAAQMCDQSPWRLIDSSDLYSVLWQTQFGGLWLLRLALGIGLGLAIVFYSSGRFRVGGESPRAVTGLMVLSFCLLVSLAWGSHAAAGIHHRILHLGVDALHLATGAVWPVGLFPLALFLRQANRRDGSLDGEGEFESLQRFSRVSFVAVLVLVTSGTINGFLMIGSWLGLFLTHYGQLLLGKMVIAGIMIGLGAFNRLRLLPRIRDTPGAFGTLRFIVIAESVLGLAVLVIVGVMGMTSPPS